MTTPKHIILSRTDSIGDVILTLPMAGVIKKHFPECKVSFLGSSYTRDIISCSEFIDDFLDWNKISSLPLSEQIKFLTEKEIDTFIHVFPKKAIAKLAKKSKIKNRIGTTNRLFHWQTCNKLIRLSRKNSTLHEAQLNIKLLQKIGINEDFSLKDLPKYYGFSAKDESPKEVLKLLSKKKFNLILQTKSKGSAREWGLDNFAELIKNLPEEKYNIFLSGTAAEGELFRAKLCTGQKNVFDISGKLSLSQLIGFFSKCNGIVSASTGPLHIAAALKIIAIGIYPPIRPMHPGRWAPIGEKATFLVKEKTCNSCRKSYDCECMTSITPDLVIKTIENQAQN